MCVFCLLRWTAWKSGNLLLSSPSPSPSWDQVSPTFLSDGLNVSAVETLLASFVKLEDHTGSLKGKKEGACLRLVGVLVVQMSSSEPSRNLTAYCAIRVVCEAGILQLASSVASACEVGDRYRQEDPMLAFPALMTDIIFLSWICETRERTNAIVNVTETLFVH